MQLHRTRFFASLVAACFLALAPVGARAFTPVPSLATKADPVVLSVDASQAGRGILFVHERIPVSGTSLKIVYPKWIPGEHGPTGPLNNLAALRVSADGKALQWRRDQIDMWGFHVAVPGGVRSIDIDFDVLMNGPGDIMASGEVAIINWNRVLLYQDGIDSHDYYVKPSIVLPPGWDSGTALTGTRSGARTDFTTVPLNMLVDSPLDMGAHVKKWTLFKDAQTYVEMDAFADAPQDLDITPKLLEAYERVPAEAFALYGSHHFANYHALLTLANEIGFQGIEHHQSSDDRAPADFLTNPQVSVAAGDLVTHEFSHSWNGKYRRPADLTTPNFQVPQQTDLLWVYEGMNQYLGDLLSFRSGIRDPKNYPQYLASIYASMDSETGRDTTPLIDLTTGAPYYYQAGGQYHAIRRSAGDFYTEGELIWLDVDTIIRERSHGARSLDTFLHKFTAPTVTGPVVDPYTRAQVEATLNDVQPYDWHGFFEEYVYDISTHPPSDDLARAGWKLVYTDKPNEFIKAEASTRQTHPINAWYSIGLSLSGSRVSDVRYGSPAWQAGFAPGMNVDAIDGQKFDGDVLDYALGKAQHSGTPMSVVIDESGWFRTLSLNYHGGILYPHLERIKGTPDMLAEIMRPHAK